MTEQKDLCSETQSEAGQEPLSPRLAGQPRQGWYEQFQRMLWLGDDQLLDSENLAASDWDKTEWKW